MEKKAALVTVANKLEIFSLAPQTMHEAISLAERFASSGFVPKAYIGNPNAILAAWQMGAEVGLQPMQALQSIAVISGMPSLYGDGALGIVQASSVFDHKVFEETYENDPGDGGLPLNLTAVCTVARIGGKPHTQRFSMLDATTAGLTVKDGPWKSYPRRMLMMRARSFAIRNMFSDILRGFRIYEEYVGYETEFEDVTVSVPATSKPKSKAGSIKDLLRVTDEEEEEVSEAVVVEPTASEATDSQEEPEEPTAPETEDYDDEDGSDDPSPSLFNDFADLVRSSGITTRSASKTVFELILEREVDIKNLDDEAKEIISDALVKASEHVDDPASIKDVFLYASSYGLPIANLATASSEWKKSIARKNAKNKSK